MTSFISGVTTYNIRSTELFTDAFKQNEHADYFSREPPLSQKTIQRIKVTNLEGVTVPSTSNKHKVSLESLTAAMFLVGMKVGRSREV